MHFSAKNNCLHVCMHAQTELKLDFCSCALILTQQVSYLALAACSETGGHVSNTTEVLNWYMIVITCFLICHLNLPFQHLTMSRIFHATCVQKRSKKIWQVAISLIWKRKFYFAPFLMKKLHSPSVFGHQFVNFWPRAKESLHYPCISIPNISWVQYVPQPFFFWHFSNV